MKWSIVAKWKGGEVEKKELGENITTGKFVERRGRGKIPRGGGGRHKKLFKGNVWGGEEQPG